MPDADFGAGVRPLFGPFLFGVMVTLMLSKRGGMDERANYIAGSENAPADAISGGAERQTHQGDTVAERARDAVRRVDSVVCDTEDYASLFASASPAPVFW